MLPYINTNVVSGGWWVVLWVIFFTAIVVVATKWCIRILENVAVRTKISKAFFGGVILGVLTSLPETIAAIFGGVNNLPMLGLFNETGANNVLTFVLATILFCVICFYSVRTYILRKNAKVSRDGKKIIIEDKGSTIVKQCFGNMTKDNRLTVWLMIIINFFFMLFIWIKPLGNYLYIPGINISVVSFIPLILFIFFTIFTLKQEADNSDIIIKKTDFFKVWKIWQLLLAFTFFAAILLFFAYMSTNSIDFFPEVFPGINPLIANGLILSLSSGAPEITSLVVLMYKKNYAMGFSAITGSQIYNMALVFLTDAIITKNSTFRQFFHTLGNRPASPGAHATTAVVNNVSEYNSALTMQPWMIAVFISSVVLTLLAINKINRSKGAVVAILGLLSIGYLVSLITIAATTHIVI